MISETSRQPAGPHLRGDEIVMRRRRLLEKVGEGAALEQPIKEGAVRTVAERTERMNGWTECIRQT